MVKPSRIGEKNVLPVALDVADLLRAKRVRV